MNDGETFVVACVPLIRIFVVQEICGEMALPEKDCEWKYRDTF